MAVVDPSSVDVPLSLFSSLDTELSAPDCPEGISPDNADVIYLPGSVSTRPGLRRVFVSALIASESVTYQKSYVLPTGAVKNLYLTNDGTLWVEDLTNAPGVASVLYVSSATMASSVTAFGREYIALSDGVHGADIPIQYDGTNLWRVTQDGPGAPPTVVSLALPASTLSISGTIAPQTVANIVTSGQITQYEGPYLGYVNFWTSLTITLAGGSILPTGGLITIAGNSTYNGSYNFLNTTGPLTFTVWFYATTPGSGSGGTATYSGGYSLSRVNNLVSGSTATPHGIKVGYQAQVGGIPASTVGGVISSIVLNNKDNQGIAVVTMTSAHGLLPNNIVNILDVTNTTVGGGISNIALAGDVVTVTTSSAHGLQVGSIVFVAPVTNAKLKGQWYVTTVPSTTTFTFVFVDADIASAADTGTVSYVWPLASANPEQNNFTVLTSPSATTFTVALSYTDGTWTGGTVTFAWDGTFYVTAVPSSTTFVYQQYGPNATTTTLGTVTPFGQMTPGIHQVQQAFLLASGAITQPSPPATFVANGGQYPSVSNLAIGPSNVVARILLFNGAGGAYFFYIPQPAQVNGLVVSTATQINDNTTTSIVLDFGDPTLYAALACSIPGNNLAAQVVIGPCAGFFTYASRLQAWGERNKVQNFLNLGFDGGYFSTSPTLPLGWQYFSNFGSGNLSVATIPGFAWTMVCDGGTNTQCGHLRQGAYADSNGNPILLANTQYSMRMKISYTGAGQGSVVAKLSDTNGSIATASFLLSAAPSGAWRTVDFTGPMRASVDPTTVFDLWFTNAPNGYAATIDEAEFIYTAQPYVDHQERMSYVANPEGFDGLTGVIGPEDDLTPIMNHGVLRNTLYIVTGNAVHETSDNGSTEPSGWNVEQLADECGAYSIASVSRNPQGVGSAGKGFMTWSGPDGAQVFTGHNPEKVSQEIQSLWDANVVDQSRLQLAWSKNDQTSKRVYYGVPLVGGGMRTLVLDYRNLPGDNIGSMPPVHISFTGKMIASDLTRKWTKWNVNATCGELMYRPGSAQPVMCFGGSNAVGGANVYTLDPSLYSDQDFGQILAYYTTYFFVSHEMEQGLQLGSHRKEYDYITAFVQGIGTVAFTPLLCSLTNAQSATPNQVLSMTPGYDYESGIDVITSRCAFKIAATPLIGQTDSYFNLQKLIINMKRSPWQPVRGTSGGSS